MTSSRHVCKAFAFLSVHDGWMGLLAYSSAEPSLVRQLADSGALPALSAGFSSLHTLLWSLFPFLSQWKAGQQVSVLPGKDRIKV